MLMPADITDHVRAVLAEAHHGKPGVRPHYLTAYQILERLPTDVRDRLIAERGKPGADAGVHHAAASVVKDALLHHLRGEVDVDYIDNGGMSFDVAGAQARAGYPVCGIYRLRQIENGEA